MQSPHTGKAVKLPVTELLKSVPEFFGLRLNEQPQYDKLSADGDIEVRRYPAMSVASVTVTKPLEGFEDEAFKRLAAYIFGENRGKKTLAMTSPVLKEPVEAGWRMTFVLPEHYTTKKAPTPLDPSVKVIKIPSRTVVALRYSGNNTPAKMKKAETELRAWLTKHPEQQVLGQAFFAQYDAPFVLRFAKRNEVQIEVDTVN